MNFCNACGAELRPGRFCINCGTPVAATATATAVRGPEDTAERPAARATLPPPPPPPPPADPPESYAGRFPLFADQVDPAVMAARDGRGRRRWPAPPLLAVAAVVLLAMVIGVAWLAGSDDRTATDDASGEVDRPSADDPAGGGDGPVSQVPADPEDLAPHSKVTGPEPIPPGRDLGGDEVRYPATNVLDDDPETAYRMPGDASGATIVFTLPQETTVNQVGLVNGYAKMDTDDGRTVDWYAKNRRVLRVEWVFDDGTTVAQDLHEDPDLQAVDVDDVRTRRIELRLVEVSAPGAPPLSKDVTAISDVLIHGTS